MLIAVNRRNFGNFFSHAKFFTVVQLPIQITEVCHHEGRSKILHYSNKVQNLRDIYVNLHQFLSLLVNPIMHVTFKMSQLQIC